MPLFVMDYLAQMIEADKEFCIIIITKLMLQILRGLKLLSRVLGDGSCQLLLINSIKCSSVCEDRRNL